MLMLRSMSLIVTGARSTPTAVACSMLMYGLCPSAPTARSVPSQGVMSDERTRNRTTRIQLRIRLHRRVYKLYTERR